MKDYFRKSLLALVILPPFLEPLPPHGKILNPLFTENPGGWKGGGGGWGFRLWRYPFTDKLLQLSLQSFPHIKQKYQLSDATVQPENTCSCIQWDRAGLSKTIQNLRLTLTHLFPRYLSLPPENIWKPSDVVKVVCVVNIKFDFNNWFFIIW